MEEEDSTGYVLRPKKQSGSGLVLGLLVALVGIAGYLAYLQWNRGNAAENELRATTTRLHEVEAKDKALDAKLETAEAERLKLEAAKEELSKNVESKDQELSRLKGTYDQLQQRLSSEVKSGEVQLTQADGKLRVDLVDKILFSSGDAQISKRGEGVLLKVGAILASIEDKQIQVSGHTDQTPISEKRSALFPTNWELSGARAINVVRFLQDQAKVPPERLVASGYGEYHPLTSNKTASGRARNRRIEILLTPLIAPRAIAKAKLKAEAKAPAAPPNPPPRHKK